MGEWFYALGRERSDPVNREQLDDFISKGIVTPGALVWTRGMAEWKPAIEVPGLLSPLPAAEPATTIEPSQAATSQLSPFDTDDQEAATAAPATDESPAAKPAPAKSARASASGGLEFSPGRKPASKRAGSRIKSLITKIAAVVIALAIFGGGGYLGAKHLGLLDPEIEPRLRYIPDHSDVFVTMNVPKFMTMAQSAGVDTSTLTGAGAGMPLELGMILDVSIAGDLSEKSWVAVATLNQPLEIEKMFPHGGPKDTTKAGGTKIYYDSEMASYGMDFAFALPSKSTVVVGPINTLKSVLSRRGAPEVPESFKPLLESTSKDVWMAAAADVDSLWNVADQFLPEMPTLDSKQQWLIESLATATMKLSGSSILNFEMNATCKDAKDAPLIAKEAQAAMVEQKQEALEMLTELGQSVDGNTLALFDKIKITSENGVVKIKQSISKEELDASAQQFAGAGIMQP